jgi:three-Cys-motif partner protein
MDRSKLEPYEGREQASVKHFLLKSYLERLIMITAQARFDRIAYVDAFAGPWKSARDDLSDTSFARAVDVMESCRSEIANKFNRSVSFRALFVERNPDRYARLREFTDRRTTEAIQLEAVNEDFAESVRSVADWIRTDEMAFVLIDPTGWKDIIAPTTLAPLLRRTNVEMLINVMWNFINLATGHPSQESNLRNVFGDEYETLVRAGSGGRGQAWMRAYLQRLRAASGDNKTASRLRTAWFPVEFSAKDRVFYYLTYVTHHVKGMIVFLEESARAAKYQQEVKFVVRQKRRETATRMRDIFGDELGASENDSGWVTDDDDTRTLWLELLPTAGAEIRIAEEHIADMAEKCGCLVSDLQAALRRLITDGLVLNVDARRARPTNAVDFKRGERLRRVK